MAEADLAAYCFHKAFDPQPPMVLEGDRHYLLYSAKGAIRLEAEDRHWMLPPSRAAWIPANTPITVTLTQPIEVGGKRGKRFFIALNEIRLRRAKSAPPWCQSASQRSA